MKKFCWMMILIVVVLALSGGGLAKELSSTTKPTGLEKKQDVLEKRSVYSKHWLNEDGTYTSVIYQNPVHYQQGEEWMEIDPRIKSLDQIEANRQAYGLNSKEIEELKGGGFSHAMVKNKFQLHFSANSNRPLRYRVDKNWISFQPKDGKPVKGQVGENTVKYPGVWDNSDLVYLSTVIGLKEYIILQSKEHPDSFEFRINLHGLTYRTRGGAIEFVDGDGQIQAVIPPGYMEDAEGNYSNQVAIQIEERGKALILTLIPDQEWLQAEERVYPVKVDPTLVHDYEDIVKDAYVTDYYPDETHGTAKHLEIGNNEPLFSDVCESHSYLKFNVDGVPSNVVIGPSFAYLYLYDEKGGDPATVYVKRVLESWSETTISFDTRPRTGSTYKTYMIDAEGQYDFDLDSAWVTDWVQGRNNHGFALMANNSEEKNLKYLYSREKILDLVEDDKYSKALAYQPQLYVTYATAPATPTNLGFVNVDDVLEVGNSFYTNKSSIRVKWEAPTDGVTGFKVYVNGSFVRELTSSTKQYTVSLPNEGNYRVEVKSLGHFDSQSSLSTSLNFTVDRSVSPVAGVSGTPGVGSLVVDWRDPSDVVGIASYHLMVTESKTDLGQVAFNDEQYGTKGGTVSNLSAQKSYYVMVKARDQLGNESFTWGISRVTSPLPVPSDISAVPSATLSDGSPSYRVNLSCTDADAATYILQRRYASSSYWRPLQTLSYDEIKNRNFTMIDTYNLSSHGEYVYRLLTKNKTNDDQEVTTSDTIRMPNIQPELTVMVEDTAGNPIPLGTVEEDGKTIYTLVSKQSEFTVRIPEKDSENDQLKFIIYSKGSEDLQYQSSGWKSETATLSVEDGVTRWYLAVGEFKSDGTTEITSQTGTDDLARTLSAEYSFQIDQTPPPVASNSFKIYTGAGQELLASTPNDQNEVVIQNISVQDNANGSGVQKVYFWNEGTEPTRYYDLSDAVVNNQLTADCSAEIEAGQAGIMVDLDQLAGGITSLTIPWKIASGADGTRNIYMKVADRVGNVSGATAADRIKRSIILDTQPPAAPIVTSHVHDSQTVDQVEQKIITFNWKVDDPTGDVDHFLVSYTLNGVAGTVSDADIQVTDGNEQVLGSANINVTGANPNVPVVVSITAVDWLDHQSDPGTNTVYTLAEVGAVEFEDGGYDHNLGQHFLQWQLTSPGVAQSHIMVRQNADGTFDYEHPITAENGLFTQQNLLAHETYTYRLVAINNSNDYTESTTLYVKEVPNEKPTQPVPTYPITWGPGTVRFAFAESIDYDGETDIKYHVYYGTDLENMSEVTAAEYEQSGLVHNQQYYWYVIADDQRTDGEQQSATVSFVADTIQPSLTVTEPERPYSKQERFVVTTSDGLSGIDRVEYYKINAEEGVAPPTEPGDNLVPTEVVLQETESGEWTGAITLTEGMYHLLIFAYDQAGNKTQVNRNNLWVDQSAPAVSSITLDLDQYNGYYQTGNGRLPMEFAAADAMVNGVASKNYGLRYWFVNQAGIQPTGEGELLPISPNLVDYAYTLITPENVTSPFYLALSVEDLAGNPATIQYVGPIALDETDPSLNLTVNGLVTNGNTAYVTDLSLITATALSQDLQSGIVSTEYALLTDTDGVIATAPTWSALQTVSLTDGDRYKIIATTTNGAGRTKVLESSTFVYDQSKPTSLSIGVPTTDLVQGETAVFTVGAIDPDTALVRYELAIGSTKDGNDLTSLIAGQIQGWLEVDSPNQECRIQIPQVAAGSYFTTLRVTNAAGLTETYSGPTFNIVNMNKVVVNDQGPFSMFDHRLTGWWGYSGTGDVDYYRYKIINEANQTIIDWQTTTETQVTVEGLTLESGKTYQFKVEAYLTSGEQIPASTSPGVLIDTSAPTLTAVTTPAFSTSDQISFDWEGSDSESGLSRVEVSLGTDYGLTDVTKGWVTVTNSKVIRTDRDGLPLELTDGARYYLTLRVVNGANDSTEMSASALRIDNTPPPFPEVWDQGAFINTDQALEVHWLWTDVDPQSENVGYQWAIIEHGETEADAEWFDANLDQEVDLGTVPELQAIAEANGRTYYHEHGKTYYFLVKATNGSGLTSVGWSDGIMADETAPWIPKLTIFDAVDLGEPATASELNYVTSDSNLALWIDTIDDESTISMYYYAWGSKADVDSQARENSPESTVELVDPGLADGEVAVFAAESMNDVNELSGTGYSKGLMLDTSTPRIANVNGTVSNNTFFFDWGVIPSASPVAKYEVALVPVDQADSTDVNWQSNGLNTTYSVSGTDYEDGQYVLLVQAMNRAGAYSRRNDEVNEWGTSPVVILDRIAPEVTEVQYPSYVANQMQVIVRASDNLTGISGYQYTLGTMANETEFTGRWIDLESNEELLNITLPTQCVPDQTGFYLWIRAKDGVGQWSVSSQSQQIWVDRTPPTTPVITTTGYTNKQVEIPGISYQSSEPDSAITHYTLSIALAAGGEWLFEPEAQPIEDFGSTLTGLNLDPEQLYYVTMKTRNAAGVWSEPGYSGPVVVDLESPTLTFVQGDQEIVLNQPPLDISFTLSEPADVTFSLFHDEDGKVAEESGRYTPVTSEDTFTYTFTQSKRGTYTLKAQVTDLAGNPQPVDSEQTIRVNKPPVISLPSIIYTTPGQTITFEATQVTDPENDLPLTYDWDPGDGTDHLAGVTADHAYANLGEYSLILSVTDGQNGTGTATTTVKVLNTTEGTLYSDEVWSGEHTIYGDIIVPADYTLTINPGTIVTVSGSPMTGYNHQLKVLGELKILGGAQGVTIESVVGTLGSWQGIELHGDAQIDNLTIEDALRGITVVDGIVSITNSTFKQNKVGIHVYGGTVTIAASTFSGNQLYGIKEDANGRPLVTNCLFSNNGIHYYQVENARITIEQLNTLLTNSGNRVE